MKRKNETWTQKRERAAAIVKALRAEYPEADCTLDFTSAWELLVGAILASQCTDERVNKVTPALFAAYPTPEAMAEAPLEKIERLIRSCGLYRNKAKGLKGSAREIVDHHGSHVPDTRKELMALPGVGRKIANLILGDVFGHQAVVVDTHCKRVSRLLGLTDASDVRAIERDLERVLPPDALTLWGHLMVTHGRDVCRARCRRCGACAVFSLCDYGSTLDRSNLNEDDCV